MAGACTGIKFRNELTLYYAWISKRLEKNEKHAVLASIHHAVLLESAGS